MSPKNNANKPQSGQSNNKDVGLESKIFELLHKNYKKFLEKEVGKIRADVKDHEQYLDKFFKYLERNQGRDFLTKLDGDKKEIFFSMIKDKKLSAKKIFNSETFRNRIKPANSEKTGIENMLKDIQNELGAEKVGNKIALQEFFSANGIKTGPKIDHDSTIQSIADLKDQWSIFSSKLSPDTDQKIRSLILENSISYFDQTEKMVATSIISKYASITNTHGSPQLISEFKQDFPLPLPIYFKGKQSEPLDNSVSGIQERREGFKLKHKDLFSEDLLKRYENVAITNEYILNTYFRHGGGTAKEISQIKGENISQRSNQAKRIFNSIVAEEFVENYEQSKEFIKQSMQDFVDTFSKTPPTFSQLFKKYPTDLDALKKADPTFEKEHAKHLKNISFLNEESQKEDRDKSIDYTWHIDQEIQKIEKAKRNAFVKLVSKDDANLAEILDTAGKNNFNLSRLSKEQQQYLINNLCAITLDDLSKKKILHSLGLDKEEYEKFTRDLFDLDKKTIEIPVEDRMIPIEFVDKSFLPTSIHESHFNLESMKDWSHLGFNLSVKVTEENEEYLHALYHRGTNVFNTFGKEKEGAQVISEGYRVRVSQDGESYEGYLSLRGKGQLEENPEKLEWFLYTEPVNQHQTDRDLVYKDAAKTQAVKIAREEADDRNLEILDKTLHLNGNTIGGLMLGKALGETAITKDLDFDTKEIADTIKDLTDEAREKGIANALKDPYRDTLEQQELEKDKRASDPEIQDFKETERKDDLHRARNDIQPKNKKIKLEKGASLRVQEGESEIMGVVSDQGFEPGGYWHRYEITDIDESAGTIEFTMYGGEQKHDREGQKKTAKLSGAIFDKFRSAYGINLYKTPPAKNSDSGFTEAMRFLEGSGIPKVSDKLKELGGELKLKGGKFFATHSGGDQEVDTFGVTGTNAISGKPSLTTFKVQALKNGKIKVKADELVSRGDKGQIEKKFKYNKEMDYNTFLLFVGEKGLKPMTSDQIKAFKEQQKRAYGAVKDGELSHKKTEWFGLSDFASFFKSSYTKLSDKRKEYTEGRLDELTDIMVSDWRLYQKMSNTLGFRGPWRDSWAKVDHEVRNEKAGKILGKINGRKDRYAKEPDKTPVTGEILNMVLKGPFPNTKRLHQVCGAWLYMMEKAGGMYARAFVPYAGTGLRVKALLGTAHQERYLAHISDLEARAKADPQNEDLRAQIQQAEALYINIAIDGDDNVLKHRFGIAFADEIMPAFDAGKGSEGINSTANALVGMGQFDFVYVNKFLGELSKMQTAKALGGLKAAAKLARRSYEVEKVKAGILLVMLTNANFYAGDGGTVDFLVKFSRKLGFLPGMWMYDFNAASKTSRLLQMITGDFDKIYNVEDFSAANVGNGIKSLGSGFKNYMNWRNSNGRGRKIVNFLDMNNISGDNSMLSGMVEGKEASYENKKLLKELIDFGFEDSVSMERDINNPEFYRSPMTTPKAVMQQFLSFRGTDFAGDDDQKESAQVFRSSFAKQMPTNTIAEDQFHTTTRFMVKKFADTIGGKYFTGANENDLVRVLALCKNIKNSKTPNREAEIDFLMRAIVIMKVQGAFQGVPNEIDEVVRKFKQFFMNNLDNINSDIIQEAFGQSARTFYENPGDYIPGLGIKNGINNKELQNQLKERAENGINEPLFNQRLLQMHSGLRNRGLGIDFLYQEVMSEYGKSGENSSKQQTKKSESNIEKLGREKAFVAVKNKGGYSDQVKPSQPGINFTNQPSPEEIYAQNQDFGFYDEAPDYIFP